MQRRQLRGVDAIAKAVDSPANGAPRIALVLLVDTGASAPALRLAARLADLGIPVHRESPRELRRMTAGSIAEEMIALVGPAPTDDLDALMSEVGIVFILAGLRYPTNVGYILRCLEVAGGAGVVVDCDWGETQREEAFRIGIRAQRFFSVIDARAEAALSAARGAGRRILALETSGEQAPWETDFTGSIAVLVGSEALGVPARLLDAVDEVVSIPVGGFIPSYNVQAAVGIVLGEWMRQNASNA